MEDRCFGSPTSVGLSSRGFRSQTIHEMQLVDRIGAVLWNMAEKPMTECFDRGWVETKFRYLIRQRSQDKPVSEP